MLAGTAVYGTVRTVVWEDGGGDPASYPINLSLNLILHLQSIFQILAMPSRQRSGYPDRLVEKILELEKGLSLLIIAATGIAGA